MATGERYADALYRIRPLLDAAEKALVSLPEGASLTAERLARMLGHGGATDQHALALRALADLGIVPGPHGGPVDRAALCASAAFRSGARVGLDVAAAHASATSLRLLQALPGGLDDARRAALQREADDLRAALVHLIVAAHTSLVLASPFWDDDTVEDLGALLLGRMRAGVRVDVLGRPPTRRDDAFAELARTLLAAGPARAYVWTEPMPELPYGTQSFHFKAIVADDGVRAYLGSANFTSASLRSRMELGVLLGGDEARKLARILGEVLLIAQLYHGGYPTALNAGLGR